jgi:hypothetical protein
VGSECAGVCARLDAHQASPTLDIAGRGGPDVPLLAIHAFINALSLSRGSFVHAKAAQRGKEHDSCLTRIRGPETRA